MSHATGKHTASLASIPRIYMKREDVSESSLQVDTLVPSKFRDRLTRAMTQAQSVELISPLKTSVVFETDANLEEWVDRLYFAIKSRIENDGIETLAKDLEKDLEVDFNEFKKSVKPHSMSETQYVLAQSLNAIEKRVAEFPLVSPKEAAMLMGEVNSTNASRTISAARDQKRIFAFTFGDSKATQVPAFQFNATALKVWQPVPELAQILSGLNDWGVYSWFTTHNYDLECTPAEALGRPDLYEDLVYLAGLFKSESTLAHLSFIAEDGEGNE